LYLCLECGRVSITRRPAAKVANPEDTDLFENEMGGVLRQIQPVEFEFEKHRGPLRRGRRGVFPLRKTANSSERAHHGRGVRSARTARRLLGGVHGEEHGRGTVDAVRDEQRERLDRVLQRHLREHHPDGQASVERPQRRGRGPRDGLGGKHAHVLQLLSQQGFQRGPTVPLPRAAGVRRDGRRLSRPAVLGHRQEIDRRVQAAHGGDPSAVLPVLQQRVRRLGLLH